MVTAFPDRDVARKAFEAAAKKAASKDPLPAIWIDLVAGFEDMKTRGYIVALGTALLAKATDQRVDPLALQVGSPVAPGRRGYSARTFCSAVLVREGRKIGLDIGLHGDEPLQGNPFTDEERLHRKLPARYPGELDRLVTALEAVDKLSRSEALEAFAAYVRVRKNVAAPVPIPLPTNTAALAALIASAQAYAHSWSERSRVGQALVAGALDVVLNDVTTTNVYASSKKRPGDVRVETTAGTTTAIEVRQKTVDEGQVQAFATELGKKGIARGSYVAMAKGQKPLPSSSIAAKALENGVAFATYSTLAEFLATVVTMASSVDDFLAKFPDAVMTRLLALGASEKARQAWADAVASAT